MLTKNDIEKYFTAEKNESLLFIMMGIAAIVLATVFFFYLRSNLHKGAAIPLIIIGLMHILVGATVFKRSDKDRIRVTYAYDMNPSDISSKEIPRMELVNKNFIIYQYTEIALLLIGFVLYFFFRSNPDKSFWVGLGLALLIEAAVSFGADYFGEKRATDYTIQLKEFVKAI